MRVLLIQPPHNPHIYVSGLLEPLGLEVLAGALPEHDVRILDMRLDPGLEAVLNEYRPQVVGITAITTEVSTALATARRVKNLLPDIPIVVGGHHATVEPEAFALPEVNVIAIGPGEDSFPALVAALARGKALHGIPGLALVGKGVPPYLDLPKQMAQARHPDDMPAPRRDLTHAYRSRYWMQSWRRVALLSTTRGCPFRCNFCANWKLAAGKYKSRDPERVVDELLAIEEKYVYFADDNTFLSPKHAEKLCDLIMKAGIHKRYFGYIRADTVARHPDLIARWAEIGLDSLVVGIESFREEDLLEYHKEGQIDINIQAIRVLQRSGIINYAHLIVRPEFTRPDFDALLDFVKREGITRPVFPAYTPLPGTELAHEKRSEIASMNYDLYDLGHMIMKTKLPPREFYAEMGRLWRLAYSLRRYIKASFLRLITLFGLGKNIPPWRLRRLPLGELLWVNLTMTCNPLFGWRYVRSVRLFGPPPEPLAETLPKQSQEDRP